MNYGLPEVETSETNSLIYDKSLEINHQQIRDTKLITSNQINSLNDGKLTKNFMKTFLLDLVISKFVNNEPDYKFNDMRALKVMFEKGIINKSQIIEDRRQFFHFSKYNDNIVINIPAKYYSKSLYKQINLPLIRKNIICVPYTPEDLGDGINLMKKSINGRLFKNNVQFEGQISQINQKFYNKCLEIYKDDKTAEGDMTIV